VKLTYPVSRILSSVAEREALRIGVSMAIAIADEAGGMLFFGRMDGTLPASSEIAIGKAYTASALRMSTEEVGRLAQPEGVLYGIQHTHGGKIIVFGGGLPLRLEGRVAGSIGISGGSVDQDIRVARAVVSALEEMEALRGVLRRLLPGDAGPREWLAHLVNGVQAELLRRDALQYDPDAGALIAGALHLLWSGPDGAS
jgi:uncharacterized protein GlcG (DUF336 family)